FSAAVARKPLQEALATGYTPPREFMEELEALDEFEFLRRDPRTGFARDVVEFGPGFQCLRQAKAACHGLDDQRAARIRFEVEDWGQKVRAHGAQSFGAVEGRLNIALGLVREADDEGKMAGDSEFQHLFCNFVHLLDFDVLADTL